MKFSTVKKGLILGLSLMIPVQAFAWSWPSINSFNFTSVKNTVVKAYSNFYSSLSGKSKTDIAVVGGISAATLAYLGYKKYQDAKATRAKQNAFGELNQRVRELKDAAVRQRDREAQQRAQEEARQRRAEQQRIEQEQQLQLDLDKIKSEIEAPNVVNGDVDSDNQDDEKVKAEAVEEARIEALEKGNNFCSQLTRGYLQSLYLPQQASWPQYLQSWYKKSNIQSKEDYFVAVNKNYSPDEHQALSQVQQVGNFANLHQQSKRAIDYINKGQRYLAALLNGQTKLVPGYAQVISKSWVLVGIDKEVIAQAPADTRKQYLDSIISVVWALYDNSLNTKNGFSQGAFNMQNRAICNFFYEYIEFVNPGHKKMGLLGGNCNNPYGYQRMSTHLIALSKLKEIYQYGIDIRFEADQDAQPLLPNHMKHILFIPYDGENCGFIVKPEDDCMYQFKDIALHSVGVVRSKTEGLIADKTKEIHQRKERVPKKWIEQFNSLIDSYCPSENLLPGSVGQEPQWKKEDKAKACGVRFMLPTLQELNGEPAKPEWRNKRAEFVQELNKYNHNHMRFGREIIFTQDELLSFAKPYCTK
ncbi:hypothetical protein HRU45_04000 [Candidatus Dependentiae bacterium]|nr:hypothetical protein [Candidatus Dependentiae bacterium]